MFKRYKGNPILSPKNWPYKISGVFNPGVALYKNKTILLARVEDLKGFSCFCIANSTDGFTGWEIISNPELTYNCNNQEEMWGIEDPRIVYIKEMGKFAISYVSFSRGGPVVSLMLTSDFNSFERQGVLLPPEDKDASLFPRRFNGLYALIHRPIVRGEAHIWISFSPDLKYWGDNKILIPTRPGWWDCHHVGLGTQPIETDEGWLIIYHGARMTASGAVYRVGLALLDLEEPWKLIKRSDEWVFGPEEQYELVGISDAVVFPTGAIYKKQEDRLIIYYGSADYSICIAEAKMSDLIDYLMKC
ncbi:glycosidase [candidate division WOR-3 bacterium]|jgi:predicted GH43/DUF377 family glycosyl hydrolase|nr:glycosidase [candidate division WOR-3 bacterium]